MKTTNPAAPLKVTYGDVPSLEEMRRRLAEEVVVVGPHTGVHDESLAELQIALKQAQTEAEAAAVRRRAVAIEVAKYFEPGGNWGFEFQPEWDD